MPLCRLIAGMLFVALMGLGADLVSGQSFPYKPIRIVTSPVGGSSDFTSRQIAQGISESLGQQVIVENRGDISGVVVSKALPDGYTLLVDSVSFWISSLLQKMPFDPVKDFSPVMLATTAPNTLAVHPQVPAKSVKELIALAKAKPGMLNYGTASGNGSGSHLAAELFKSMTGIDAQRIDYKGSGPLALALVGGEVHYSVASTSSTMPHVRAGRLRALAATSLQPSVLLPGLPTVSASGVPGYEVTATVGVFAPTKTPEAVINLLNREMVRVLHKADVKERFFNNGAEVVGSSPGEHAAAVTSDRTKWAKVIKDAGIRAD